MSNKRFREQIAHLCPVPALSALAAFVALAAFASLLLLLSPGPAPVTAAPAATDPALDISGVTLAITGTTTTVARTSGSDPSTYGYTLTFRATVTRVDTGTALTSGTVTFKDNGVNIPGCVTKGLGSGYAQCSTGALTGGEHTITAHYSGSGNFASSVGILSPNQTVNKASVTSFTLTCPDNSVYGEEVTCTADVDPDDATGMVFFDDNGTEIGRDVLDSQGKATMTTFSLAAGPHVIKAIYHGDVNYEEAESDVEDLTVAKAGTSTTLVSSPDDPPNEKPEYGQYVTFTATVTPADPTRPGATTPTGFVTFRLFGATGTPIGQGLLNGEGVATFSTADLAVGTYWVVAVYEGEANYNASVYLWWQTVYEAETETVIEADPSSPTVYGESVTFTAEVKRKNAGVGAPTGEVVFSGWGDSFEATLYEGEAIFMPLEPFDADPGNPYEIKAEYQGDDNFKKSDDTVDHTVNKAATTTEVHDPLGETDYGQDIQFTISVKVDEPGSGIPTEMVGVIIVPGPPVLIVEELPEGSSVVTIVTNTLRPGVHAILATYFGDANFLLSFSETVTHTVNKADSSTSLESSANPSAFGQSVTFTATVEAAGLGLNAPITPTGTVTFKDGGAAIPACPAPVPLASAATCTTSDLSAGSHDITAEYSGDSSFKPSEDSLRQTVNTIATTTALSGPSSSAIGDSVTFTATVSETLSGDPVTDGDVTFYDGVTELLPAKALNGSGQATYNTSSLSAGLHPLKAVYNGTENFQASTSGRLYHTVTAVGSTTTLTSTPNASNHGQSVTFTATVTRTDTGAPITSGTVTFMEGPTTLGTGPLNGWGQATFSKSDLTAGTHLITAVFAGDASFGGSTSNVVNQVVNKVTPAMTVTDNPDPTVYGAAVTLVATVAPVSGGAMPTGTVSFTVGATVLGTVTLNGAGQATLVTSAIPGGPNQTITANYSGDNNYISTSGTTLHTVDPASTTTAVTTSPNPSLPGQLVTLTANVTWSGGTVNGGTVQFSVNSSAVGGLEPVSGGVATYNHTFASAGTYNVTAVYSGNSNFQGSNNNASPWVHTVGTEPADLSVTKADSPDPVNVGDNLTYIINVANHGPESTTVTLTDTLPSEVTFVSVDPTATCSHSDGTITCNLGTFNKDDYATVTIVVNVPLTTPAGTVLENTAQVSGTRPDSNWSNNTSIAETTVYRSPRRGDCNGDNAVNLADVWAIVRDIFDPTFQGTSGCDANKDQQVDAGDVPSTVLIMLNGLNAGDRGGDLNAATEGPALTLPDQAPAVPGGLVTLPVSFAANGHSITSLAFSVDYDETWLALDPTDRDGNGIPDAVIFSLPGDFTTSVTFDGDDADGEVDIFIGDISPPLTSLSDGPIVFMILNVDSSPGSTQGAVRFSLDPTASFGDTSGQSVPGTATPTGRYPYQIYLPVLH